MSRAVYVFVWILLAATMAFSGCGASEAKRNTGQPAASPTTSGSSTSTYMIVLSAESGESSAPDADNTIRVTLQRPDRDALWFTDRPERRFGDMELQELVNLWKTKDVLEDPPNATLEFVDQQTGKRHHAVLEITGVELRPDGALAVTCTPLKESPTPHMLPDGKQLNTVSQSFTSPTLFIDAFPTSVNSQITD